MPHPPLILERTWRWFVWRFGIVGVLVAVVLLIIPMLFGFTIEPPMEKIYVILWPNSLMLMATSGSLADLVIVFIAVASNGVLYGILGVVVSLFYRFVILKLRKGGWRIVRR